MRLGDTLCQVSASGVRIFTLPGVAELRSTRVGATHTHAHTTWALGREGDSAPPHRGQVPKIILASPGTGRALWEPVPTFEAITARAIAHDSLRTSEKGPQSPIPFCAKLRPTEPPFLESTRMCKRARATRASGEAAAERLPPPAAPNPDFRSPTFAPFLFAPLFGERTEAPASGRRLPARARLPPPPTSHSFPPCPAAGPGRGVGGAAFPAASAAPLVRVPRRRRA